MKSPALFLLVALTLQLHAASTIGAVRVTPMTAVIGTPTQITVIASIADPVLIAGSVDLAQLNIDGTTTLLGTLHDDGLNGDLSAGDGVFTFLVTLNRSSAAQVQLETSAAFKGVLHRVKSPVINVFFQAANAPQQALSSLASSLAAGNVSTALNYINPSSNATAVLTSASQQTLNFLASLLNTAVLVRSGPDSRIFHMPVTTASGGLANMEFDMVPGVNGQWVINSW